MTFSKLSFKSLLIAFLLAFAFQTFCARVTNGQEQQNENCRRLTADGECIDMKLTLLGDGDPRQMPIILFNSPDVSEAQARELVQLFTPVLVKEFGRQIAIVTEERQIPRSWQGRRYVLTYRVRVSPVASTLEPVKAKKVAARKGAEFGRDMIDVLIQALPGNGRIAARAKGKAADGAREVAQDQIDRARLGQQGRDRTYAVTAEVLRGDSSLFKAIKPTTKYFVVREVFNTQANRIDFYLIGEGERRDQIVERDEPIYLGYTFDGSVDALTEQMFLTLLRQGGAVTRYLRDPDRLDSVATNPALPPPGFMPECKELFWKAAEDAKTGRWVCKDQPAKAQQPACPTGTLKRDSSGDWRCVAEAPAQPVQQELRSALGTIVPDAPAATPDPWGSCPQEQRRMEGGHRVCAPSGVAMDLAGMQPRPVSPSPPSQSVLVPPRAKGLRCDLVAPAAAKVHFTRTYGLGDIGAELAMLQTKVLVPLGLLELIPTDTPGRLGEKTSSAIKALQSCGDLDQSGVLDRQTIEKLFDGIKPAPPKRRAPRKK